MNYSYYLLYIYIYYYYYSLLFSNQCHTCSSSDRDVRSFRRGGVRLPFDVPYVALELLGYNIQFIEIILYKCIPHQVH